MKINKQQIISKTIMFLVIVGAVIGFKSVFGDKNTLVGVAGITAALSLLGTDYTLHPIKYIVYFVLIEVSLGLGAYIASINAILGLIITFIVIFYILYSFTYNTKKPTYVAFTLGYLFMLYSPVNINELPTRLAGLAFCGLLIMALQLIVNKNKLKKEVKSNINNSIKLIIKEIDLIINNKITNRKDKSINNNISNSIRKSVSNIYKMIDTNIELPSSLIKALCISKFIESINLTLGKIQDDDNISNNYEKSLELLKMALYSIDDLINDKITIDEIIKNLDNIYIELVDINSKYYLTFELQNGLSILIDEFKQMKNKGIESVTQRYFVPNVLDNLNRLKYNISKDSLKFTFALRGALITSIGVFIVSALNLEYGKWLVFSLSSIVQPYMESSIVKSKDRIIGTIIGLVIFEFVFSIITDTSIRTIIILAVGYISNYQTKYRNQMICTTVSALGAASMTANIDIISFERVVFVLVGTIIALYANKLILPYKMTEVTKREVSECIKLNEKILSNLYDLGISNSKLSDDTKQLMIINDLLNKKIFTNNGSILSSNIDEFLYNQRIFANKVRFLVNNFRKFNENNINKLNLFYEIDMLIAKDSSREEIIKYFNKIEDDYTKVVLVDVIELNENVLKSKSILKNILVEIN